MKTNLGSHRQDVKERQIRQEEECFAWRSWRSWVLGCFILMLIPGLLFSQETQSDEDQTEIVRTYRTRDERRKAGLKYEINEWISLTGLLESEYLYESSANDEDEFSASLQLGLEVNPLSWAKLELVYEYDAATNDQILDEAIAGFEAGDFDAELGMLYVPFGEYFSHFVTGALLEFGETRDIGAVLSYTPEERLDLSAFLYNGNAGRIESESSDLDWGFSAEYSPFSSCTIAVSYLSDLADSEHGFLDENDDLYQNRVSALSGYALLGHGPFEVTVEFVHALGSFQELTAELNRPSAWNVELAYYPIRDLELAFRYEGSRELENAPQFRAGLGGTMRVIKNVYLSLEYLHGTFDEPGHAHYFGARISIL